ncbi:MAG: protein kinase domain-containing protein [Planctomycetota bacterium]
MSEEFASRVRTAFAKVRELDDLARERFLAATCANDAELGAELRSLLRAHEGVGRFLETPAIEYGPAEAPLADLVPQRYRTVRTLGAGGMGTVYLAQQLEPVERQVALKVLQRALTSVAGFHRFDFERHAIALMDHTHVAKLFDSGTTADGRPYFAMEYVPGPSITSYANAHALSVDERVRLLIPVCLAVHHAHQKGVIHRDLKPENILIMEQDGHPIPKVIDFGVAKSLAPLGPAATTGGLLIGTLEYMSPEQALRAPTEVDTRTDIYSLGVILYQLVSGTLPLALEPLREQGLSRVLRALETDNPPPPSARAAAQHRRRVRGDLDRIILKAIAKDPARRYAAASALADDLLRFLNHEPVSVGPTRVSYRLRKFARRHASIVIGALIATAALAGGLVVSVVLLVAVSRERDHVLEVEGDLRASLSKSARLAASMAQLTEDQLANIAGNTRARLSFAETALSELLQLAAMPQAPAEIGAALGYAHQRQGEARAVAGQVSAALESHDASLHVRLLDDSQGAVAARRTLGVGHWKMSEALFQLGRFADARAHDVEAHEILTTLATDGAFTTVPKGVYLGIAERRLGEVSLQLGDFAAAFEHFAKCLAVVEPGLVVEPENLQLLRAKALALRGRAESQLARPELGAAVPVLDESLAILVALGARAGPNNLWERTQEARTRLVLAEVQLRANAITAAEDNCRRAQGLASALSEADPQNAESQLLWARAQICCGQIARAAGRNAESAQVFNAALLALRPLAELDTAWMWPRREMAVANIELACLATPTSAGPQWSCAAELLRVLDQTGRLPPADAALLTRCEMALTRRAE